MSLGLVLVVVLLSLLLTVLIGEQGVRGVPNEQHETVERLHRMHRRRGPEVRGAFRFTLIARTGTRMATSDVLIFDTTLRDGEQAPATVSPPRRSSDSPGSSTRSGWTSWRPASRRHPKATTGASARSPRRSAGRSSPRWRAVTSGTSSSPARRSAPRPRGPDPRLHLDLRPPHQGEAPDHPRGGARRGPGRDPPGAPVHRRRRVLGRGRQPHRPRVPLPDRGGRDRGGRHARSTCPTPSATPCRPSTPRCSATCCARVPGRRRRRAERPLPRRPRSGGGQLAGRHRGRARGRWSAPSTASASAPATRRWRSW